MAFGVLDWSWVGRDLHLTYELDGSPLGAMALTETIELPDSGPGARSRDVAAIIDLLAVVAGVSYAKTIPPGPITYGGRLNLSPAQHEVAAAVYDHGMREYAFANGFGVPVGFRLPAHGRRVVKPVAGLDPSRALIPVGAGRDSSLLAAVLGSSPELGPPPLLMTIGDNPYAAKVADVTGLELLTVRRTLAPQLADLNAAGALNGHVPVTAINSLISAVVAAITGCGSVVMANERSASQPTRVVDGCEINHQYSKSLPFETLLRTALAPSGIDYYSALRPWGELPIAAAFARCEPTLHRAFMSCNQAFLRDPARRSDGWCGRCPKCRSVFLSMAPFMAPADLVAVFGRDLLDDTAQIAGFTALVDPNAKPFDCVGEIDEARVAFQLLGEEPAWRDHAVVRAIADLSLEPTDDRVLDRSDDHHVPPRMLQVLAGVIDGAPPRPRGAVRAAG